MFKHTSENGTSYSLAISIDDENEDFFSKLEDTIAELVASGKPSVQNLNH